MESGNEDEENAVYLRAALERKQQELKDVQDEFDEYTQSSHELELELEQELERAEKRNSQLTNKNQHLERDLQLTRSQLEEVRSQLNKGEDDMMAMRAELQAAVAVRRRLEQEQDDFETRVRVLQATEADLQHKLEREMEEKVFLVSDQEELQREHELAGERLRAEIMDLKSELYALQKKLDAAQSSLSSHRGSFSSANGNDSMATTRSQSEDDDYDYESSDAESVVRPSTMNERDELSREVLIESLRQEIEALSARAQEETEARAALETEALQLHESLAQMEALEAEITDMTDELIAKSQDISAKDAEMEKLRDTITTLQTEAAALREKNMELANEGEHARGEFETRLSELGQLEDKASEMEKLEAELAAAQTRCEELEQSERKLKTRLERQTQTLEELKAQVSTLTTRLDNSKQERSELERKVLFGKGEISQNRKEVEELNTLNTELQEQLEQVSRKVSELERASAMSTASSSASQKEADPKRLLQEIQSMRTSINSLTAENSRLRSQEGLTPSAAPAKRVSADVLQTNYSPEQLARKYLAERTRNASLLSRLQTVCGNIQVFCRVRPIISEELDKSWGAKLSVNVVNQSDLAAMDIRAERSIPSSDNDNAAGNGEVVDSRVMEATASNASWKVFTFDRILGPEETQNDVFREVEPIAQSVVDGFKACIFAYGQTGSGKTYTMEGTPSDPGLNYRVISHLFQSVQLRGEIYNPDGENNQQEHDVDDPMSGRDAADLPTSSELFHVQVAVLEIYNDTLRDLVCPTNPKALEIRHDSSTGDICVPDLTMATVSSPQQTIDVLRKAQTNRVTGKTNVNSHSSRSHSVVIVQISKRRPANSGPETDPAACDAEDESCGKLYLVDLAGSERVKKSDVSGAMLREAAHINKSLSALADVMEALDKKLAHVPYRNSKLTYLLQDVLNSSCKTVMIVNVGPTSENASETYRSLQLAERVRNIVVGRNQIVKNKKDILSAKKAFAELQSLKQQMAISTRKYRQSQQSVVAMKRDQKNQSEKQSAGLHKRLKVWESQNENLKTQNESLKQIVDDLGGQLKGEREARQKEAEQREAAQRLLRQQSSKTRVSSSQQEAQQKLLHDREEEIKKLRQQLTEARRRSTSALIPRVQTSSPPLKKARSSRSSSTPDKNGPEDESAAKSGLDNHPPLPVAPRPSKTRSALRKSAGPREQTNGTNPASGSGSSTDESPRTSSRRSSFQGVTRPTASSAARVTTKPKSTGLWK